MTVLQSSRGTYFILPNYIQYVRYLDDLLIGVVGSRKFLIYLNKKVNDYLKSNLHLRISEHKSINRNQSPILFLGYKIQIGYFYQKMRIKSKRLEAICRYKNKVIQKLKLEEYKISKFQMNKFKKKVSQHVDIISTELNLSFVQKSKRDVFASLFAYKLFGDALAKTLRFSHLRELVSFLFLWFDSGFLQNSTLQKIYNLIYKDILQDPSSLLWYKNAQMYSAKFCGIFRIKKT